ncbi:MAG: hypothetical protein ABIO92_02340 [Chloroflexia bacterium]
MEKKLTLARAVLSFCAATILLAPALESQATTVTAKSPEREAFLRCMKDAHGRSLVPLSENEYISDCPVCDPPPNPGPIPIIGDPPKPKPKPTPHSASILPCIECEPRPTEREPMPFPAPIKKGPAVA